MDLGTLPPQLRELVEEYNRLASAFHRGELTQADATAALEQMTAVDGQGVEWRIDTARTQGPTTIVFSAGHPGTPPQPADPGSFSPPRLPPHPDLPVGGRTETAIPQPPSGPQGRGGRQPTLASRTGSILDEDDKPSPAGGAIGKLAAAVSRIKLPGGGQRERLVLIAVAAVVVVTVAGFLTREDSEAPLPVTAECSPANVVITGTDPGSRVERFAGCLEEVDALEALLDDGELSTTTVLTRSRHDRALTAVGSALGSPHTPGGDGTDAVIARGQVAVELDRLLTAAGMRAPDDAGTVASDADDVDEAEREAQRRLAAAGYSDTSAGEPFRFSEPIIVREWVALVGSALADESADFGDSETADPSGAAPSQSQVNALIAALTSGDRELAASVVAEEQQDGLTALQAAAFAGLAEAGLQLRAGGPATAQEGEAQPSAAVLLEVVDLVSSDVILEQRVELQDTGDSWVFTRWPQFEPDTLR